MRAGAPSFVEAEARRGGRLNAAARVAMCGLSAAYPAGNGEGPVLAGVNVDLAPGERLAVVGASGSGKSTLLHVLAGLLAPVAGVAEVDGREVEAGSGQAAYMFQQDLLLPWKTVLGNTVFAASVARAPRAAGGSRSLRPPARSGAHTRRLRRDAREAEARSILEEFGLGGALDVLPAQLSGGMRQRVALARTLMLGRGLILLDEPFGSLDTLTRAEMQRWLLDVMVKYPATWVLVTHDVREAALLCDRVAVLGGKPARLEHLVRVPLETADRWALAAAGVPDSAAVGGAEDAAPAATLRRAVADLHGLLAATAHVPLPA
jgi:putative hydroxymethylpyrimidine transport system ATP-binding protein